MQRAIGFALILMVASCSSSSQSSPVDGVAPAATEAPGATLPIESRQVVAAQFNEFVAGCEAGDGEACQSLAELDEDLAASCKAGDTSSCGVLATVNLQAGDLLCLSWDDLILAESIRSTFTRDVGLSAEEEARLAAAEVLRSASLATVRDELGAAATEDAVVAMQSLERIPIGTPDGTADAIAQMQVLANFLDVACATPE